MIRKILTRADGLPSNTVRSIVCDRQGLFWIVTEKGICRYDGQKLYPLPLPQSSNPEENLASLELSMFACAEDSSGSMWFASISGILRFTSTSGKWKWYKNKNSNNASANQITGLHCDRRGKLWIGTLAGLLSYDNRKDSCIAAFPELAQESIRGFSESRDGRLWFSVGQNTLATYQPTTGKLTISTPKGCENGLYLHTVPNSYGAWISPLSGASQAMEAPRLVVFDSVRNECLLSYSGLPAAPQSLKGIDVFLGAEGEDGSWYSRVQDYAAGRCENGLYRMKQAQFTSASEVVSADENLFQEQLLRGTILGFSRSPRTGIVCAGISGQGLAVLIPTGMERLASYKAIGDAISLLTDKHGRTWCGTEQGLFLRSGTKFSLIPFAKNSRPPKAVENIRSVGIRQSPVGQEKVPVYDIQQTSTGTILVGTVEGLYYYNESTKALQSFPALTASLGRTTIRRIVTDRRSKEFWLYASSLGVVRCREDGSPLGFFSIGQPSSSSDTTALGTSSIFTMLFDHIGNLWMGGTGVLLRWHRQSGRLERLTALPNSQLTLIPHKIVESFKNSLLGTFYGVGLGAVNTFSRLFSETPANNLISLAAINKRLFDIQIIGIASVGQTLWWATKSNGVYRGQYNFSDSGEFSLSPPLLLLPSDDNTSTKGSASDAATQQTERGWNVGSITPDGSGGVIFDYYGDVLHADRRARAFTDTARVVAMEWLRNDTLAASVPQHGDTLHCAYNGSFQILCGVVSMIRPERHHLEYKLEGVDDRWNTMPDAGLRTLRYSSLPPGEHTLLVRTRAQDPWEDEPLYSSNIFTLHVHVPYPWWMHPVTRAVAVVVFAAGFIRVGAVIQRRRHEREIQKLTEENEKQVILRKLSEAQMQTLRLQMKPHFMFNVMAEIQRLVEIQNSALASHYISIFSKLLSRIVLESGKDFISVSDEISILQQYLALEELRNTGRMKWYLTLGSDETAFADDGMGGESSEILDFDNPDLDYWRKRQMPTFILQPFIENAIRHGIRGLEEEDWKTREIGIVSVHVSLEQGKLHCVIEDNGIGREEAARRKAERKKQENLSIATTVTAERMQLLQTVYGIELPVTYNDLYDEDGKGAGTQVTVVLPCVVDTAKE
ncbi:MAG: histidine kinase [Candidatus Kapabacteria bacterium]|jgi:ligand-binding sensor domain-containing protein|nr:histidine kinase [Candidatus Kapabacteria bacterium]